jgi:hypothetical protein
LPVDPIESSASGFAFQVERFYAGLTSAMKWVPPVSGSPATGLRCWGEDSPLRPGIPAAEASPASEPSLGGKLLYAGDLDAEARALLVAASIAGAASLAVTSDSAAGKQAVRDGVVDFLVTSLDESLRILKNEIRKRQPVAVCVAVSPQAVQGEMLQRGVAPDLARLGSSAAPECVGFLRQGAKRVEPADVDENHVLVIWSVTDASVLWLPKLDAIALGCLSELDWADRRWLRLAPRYLGRLSQGLRLLRSGENLAANFLERVREEVESGKIGITVEFSQNRNGQREHYRFAPPIG